MPEYKTLSRTTGATVLTLVAVACAAGLADVLRRRRGRRMRASGVLEAPGAAGTPETGGEHIPQGTGTVPRQRRTGPRAESVRLTPAERDAFAVLVRRLSEED